MMGIIERVVGIGRLADQSGGAAWKRVIGGPPERGSGWEPLKAGTLLGDRYKVERFLFWDGRHNHYVARDVGDKGIYELKESPHNQGIEVEREIVSKQLDHEGMVRRYGLFAEDSRTYLVSDYHRAPDLEESVRVLSARDILGIAFNLADTLNYLHSHGIAHIELSARNIKDMGDVQKIIDFSGCRLFSDLSTEEFREAKGRDFLGLVDLVERMTFRIMEESEDPSLLYLVAGLEEMVTNPPVSAEDFRERLSRLHKMVANMEVWWNTDE
jgi:serine/threonine protein kinase